MSIKQLCAFRFDFMCIYFKVFKNFSSFSVRRGSVAIYGTYRIVCRLPGCCAQIPSRRHFVSQAHRYLSLLV